MDKAADDEGGNRAEERNSGVRIKGLPGCIGKREAWREEEGYWRVGGWEEEGGEWEGTRLIIFINH